MPKFGFYEEDGRLFLKVDGRQAPPLFVQDAKALELTSEVYLDLTQEIPEFTGLLELETVLSGFYTLCWDLSVPAEGTRVWHFGTATCSLGWITRHGEEAKSPRVDFPITYDYTQWREPYSISDFANIVKSVVETNPDLGFQYWDNDGSELLNGFGASLIVSPKTKIGELPALASSIPRLVQLIEDRLHDRTAEDAVVVRFDFPVSVRNACEQYLVYFGQFLKDLGMSADTELREEASSVLFTVTPKDKEQVLSSIREALSVYLKLPGSPDFLNTNYSRDVAVTQLQANVLHLQSQLALAGAFLEAKNATIAAQSQHIAALKGQLDLMQFTPSTKPSPTATSESEPILGDLVKAKKYDLKFIEINVPELVRKLKRLW